MRVRIGVNVPCDIGFPLMIRASVSISGWALSGQPAAARPGRERPGPGRGQDQG